MRDDHSSLPHKSHYSMYLPKVSLISITAFKVATKRSSVDYLVIILYDLGQVHYMTNTPAVKASENRVFKRVLTDYELRINALL